MININHQINQSVEEFYEREDVASWLLNLPLFKGELNFIKNLTKESKFRVIDIGCGSGRLYPILSKYGFDYRGIDPSPKQIAKFKSQFTNANISVAKGTNIPFDDDSFDAALLAFHVIEAIPSSGMRITALKESRRVLRKGGLLLISHHRRMLYHPILQIKYMLFHKSENKQWGDLILTGKPGTEGISFSTLWMHIPSNCELSMLAKKSGFIRKSCTTMGNNNEGIFSTFFSKSVIEIWEAV